MPRIFHLIKSLGRGGAEVLLAEALRHSDRAQFVYGYGYFLPWKSAMVRHLTEQGAEVTCFEARNNLGILFSARKVARHIRDWDADLLHCHLPIAGIVGRLASHITGIPMVYTEHNRMERYHPITRWMNLLTWRWQDRVIAVSGEVAASISRHANGSASLPVEVVLNGIDVERFNPTITNAASLRSELGIPSDAIIVGTVAVFRRQKALHDWLEAARILHDTRPDIHFILVGDGPLRIKLMDQANSHGISKVVHFTGMKDDVRPYLNLIDVFMISSIFEGLPLALLEAMAMRCAVVATSVGGMPEVIRHGENGYLIEAGEPESLARQVLSLVDAAEVSRRIGFNARKTIEEGFSLRRMTRQLEATYLDVLGCSKYVP
jgi:glycosyltransferase involved in cell wall biosynthesis